MHGQAIQGFSTALSDVLKGIAPQVQQAYGGAADRQAVLAKGFSDGARAAISGATNQSNDYLAKLGNTNQTVADNSQQVGDVLYGLGGYIPASTLNREGAAYTAAAQNLPANTLNQGLQDYTSNLFAGRDEQRKYADQIAELAGKTPQVATDLYNTLQDLKLKQAAAQRQAANDAFNQAYKTAELKRLSANDRFNQSYKLSQAQATEAYRQATLDLRSQGLALQQQRLANDLQKQIASGAKPSASLSKVYGYIVDSNGEAILDASGKRIAVKSTSGKRVGLSASKILELSGIATQIAENTLHGFTDQNGDHHEPISFGQALAEMRIGGVDSNFNSTGAIPLPIALRAMRQAGWKIPAKYNKILGGAAGKGNPFAKNGASYSPTGGGYPLGTVGKIIGTPYAGTHTLGNWESDNAIDIAVPVGTPVYAVEDGVIGPQIGPLNSSNPRMAGERLHLVGSNEYYYAHLSQLAVHAGERVRKGQLLGYSGSANGVAHLHFAAKAGDPRNDLGGNSVNG